MFGRLSVLRQAMISTSFWGVTPTSPSRRIVKLSLATASCRLPNPHTPAMAGVVLSWFEALGVRALNTYCAHSGVDSVRDPEALWTCGRKRTLSRWTQIDFVAVSSGVSGQVRPKTFEEKIFRRSDHRPLVGTLHFNVAVAIPKTAARPSRPSLAGWLPNDGQ